MPAADGFFRTDGRWALVVEQVCEEKALDKEGHRCRFFSVQVHIAFCFKRLSFRRLVVDCVVELGCLTFR